MKNELTQRIDQMRLEAAQMGTPEMLVLFADVQAALDTQDVEIAWLAREVESWYSQNQQHIQDAVDFATERDTALAEIAALRRAVQPDLAPMKLHPSASHVNPDYRDGFNYAIDQVIKAIAQAVPDNATLPG